MIIDSHNDYLIGVKNNQRSLYNHIQCVLAHKSNQSSCFTTLEKNRGRVELRHIMVSDQVASVSKDWKGLKQIVGVHRIVKNKSKSSEEMAYFISSTTANAMWYSQGIRGHWGIENSLHWLKDVTLKEDASLIVKGNAPQNISTLKNIGINVFRQNNYTNIAQAIRLVANDIETIYNLII